MTILGRVHDYAVFLVLLLICVALGLGTDTFATADNLANVSEQVSVVGITAMGLTMLLVSGNLDLSVGGQVALIGVVIAETANQAGIPLALLAGLVTGLLLGVANGLIVTRLGVNSLVATLGSGLAYVGAAYLLSGSQPIVLRDRGLQELMSTRALGVPVPTLMFLAIIAACTWFLHFTVGGRELFAVGANAEASRYAGIRVSLVRFVPFVITGGLCALASAVLTGLLNTGDPTSAAQLPLQVIAAAVVGGVSIAGGRGTVFMATVGTVLIGVVNNGFNLLDLDSNYQSIFTGLVIVVAVAVDNAMREGAARATRLPEADDAPQPQATATTVSHPVTR